MTEKDEKFLWRVLTVMFRMVKDMRFSYNDIPKSEAHKEADEIFERLVEKYDGSTKHHK